MRAAQLRINLTLELLAFPGLLVVYFFPLFLFLFSRLCILKRIRKNTLGSTPTFHVPETENLVVYFFFRIFYRWTSNMMINILQGTFFLPQSRRASNALKTASRTCANKTKMASSVSVRSPLHSSIHSWNKHDFMLKWLSTVSTCANLGWFSWIPPLVCDAMWRIQLFKN